MLQPSHCLFIAGFGSTLYSKNSDSSGLRSCNSYLYVTIYSRRERLQGEVGGTGMLSPGESADGSNQEAL